MEEHLLYVLNSSASFLICWGPHGSEAGFPRASLFRISGSREMHLEGVGLMNARVQIDCFGQTYEEAIIASRTIRASLEGYSGGVIQGAFLDAVRDGYQTDADLAQRVSLTFVITYTE